MSLLWPHRRFTVDEYERMIEVGILREDDRVELIRGEILEMTAIGGRHVSCLTRTVSLLARRTEPDIWVSPQNPIRVSDDGEPQPDLALHRTIEDRGRPPLASEVLLVIEVSDSSLDYDRRRKLPLYAQAGILEAWIFNLSVDRIERYTGPSPDGYQTIAFAEPGQRLNSTVLPDTMFDATSLFGLESRQP